MHGIQSLVHRAKLIGFCLSLQWTDRYQLIIVAYNEQYKDMVVSTPQKIPEEADIIYFKVLLNVFRIEFTAFYNFFVCFFFKIRPYHGPVCLSGRVLGLKL